MNRLQSWWWVAMAAIVVGCNGEPSDSRNSSDRQLVIAVVPKATTHEFWKSVHAGAVNAGKDLNVKILWKGPISESDREGQINVVQDFISKKVDGICLAPLDARALLGVVREAKGEKIPTIIFDSGLEDDSDAVSYVATNNYHGGQIAARRMAELLGGKGKIIVLRYTPGSESTEQRERGFLETIGGEFAGIKFLSFEEYAGASAETALDKSQQLLAKFGDEVQGVFTPCEHVSAGMLRALEERELAGKVKFVGFDASPQLVQALREGKMHGIVLQDPVKMSYLAVENMVAHLKGKKVDRRISTGEHLATAENMDEPEIKSLLVPEKHEE